MTDLLRDVYDTAILPAYALLPPRMGSAAATAMLLACGLQESELVHRRQLGDGPARGLWQFEEGGGVFGVLQHRASEAFAEKCCIELGVHPSRRDVWQALEHNDVLAAVFARLLLFTHPHPLPIPLDEVVVRDVSWEYYRWLWRPGVPRPEDWPANWARACEFVGGLK